MNLSELRSIPPSDGPNALLDAALAYARAGWRVFPVHGWRDDCCTCGDPSCDNPAKHPLTAHGLHDATVNEAAIRRWWSQWPDANVAIRAEDIGVVIDVDPRNGGSESLDRIFTEHGGMPDTVEVLTGGGGQHFYLRAPHPVAKGKLPSYPGIDVQAGGSYVIAPPSVHRSGRRYEFEASSDWTLGQTIADCPAWILKLRGEAVQRTKSDRPVPALSDPAPAALADVQEALRFIDPDLSYPDWVKVGQALHGALWTNGFELWDQWSSAGTKYPGPAKLWRKWQSFDAHGAVTLATVFGMARDAGRQWQTPAQEAFQHLPGESLIILACDLPTTLRPPEWLVQRYVEAQALSVLFGEPGAGKSFVALDVGLSIATGTAWHGKRVKQTPVVYLCGEGWGGLQRRMHAWRDWHQVDWRGAPFAMTKRAIPLGNKQAAEALKRDIDAVLKRLGDAPGLFIVDTLARNFGAGDENSTKDMSLFIDHVGAYLMDAYKAGVMLVHHTGHGDKQRARGSSSLKGAVDAEYFVTKGDSGLVELSGLKMKDAQIPDTLYFGMRVVDLGIRDENGAAVTSVVPVPTAAPGSGVPPPMVAARRGAPRGTGDVQRACLDILVRMLGERRATLQAGGFDPLRARVSIKEWQQASIEARVVTDRKRFFDRRESLESAGLVRTENGFAYPIQEGADDGETS